MSQMSKVVTQLLVMHANLFALKVGDPLRKAVNFIRALEDETWSPGK